jgi:O-antigen ligase
LIPIGVLGGVAAIWLVLIAFARPRLLTYGIFALSPTQYIFIPVSDFFISPADVLVFAAALGLVIRLAGIERSSWHAVRQHRFIILMIASYCLGFIVLGVFSRTLVRLAIGFVPSVLACELLRTRNHLRRGATALVIAGAIDAGYGVFFLARGTPLYPTRFSGMSGVNFSAIVIIAAAVIALALRATSRRARPLWRSGALGGLGLATLSLAGVLALVAAWFALLRRVMSRSNKMRLTVGVTLVVVTAFSFSTARERILNRQARQVMVDGVARNSFDVRWAIFETAARGFWKSPVFGLGYLKFIEYSRTDPEIDASTAGEGAGTHNTYLEVLVEGGLIAFCFFALHWLQYSRRVGLALLAVYERDLVAAACFSAFVIAVVGAAFANLLVSYHYWAICGLALACLNLLTREHRSRLVTSGAAAASA